MREYLMAKRILINMREYLMAKRILINMKDIQQSATPKSCFESSARRVKSPQKCETLAEKKE